MIAILATWWFWITLVVIVGLIICEATESPIASTICIGIGVLLYQLLTDINLYKYATENPLDVIKIIGLYFVIGTAWCVTKWWLHVLNVRDKYRETKERFCTTHKIVGDIPHSLREDWFQFIGGHYRNDDYPPKARKNKSKIIRWLAYWPPSMIWTLISDFVRRIARTIYNLIASTLQRISDKVFEKDIVKFK